MEFYKNIEADFSQKQEQLKNMKNVFNCTVFLSFVKSEVLIEVALF